MRPYPYHSLNEKVYKFAETDKNPYKDFGKTYSIFNKIVLETDFYRTCVADVIELAINNGYKPIWDERYKVPVRFSKGDETVELKHVKLKIHYLFAEFLYNQKQN